MQYYGPFQINEVINDVAYRLELHSTWTIHNAFHVSLLKLLHGEPSTGLPDEEQPDVEEEDEVLVPKQIISHQDRKVKGRVARHYLIPVTLVGSGSVAKPLGAIPVAQEGGP